MQVLSVNSGLNQIKETKKQNSVTSQQTKNPVFKNLIKAVMVERSLKKKYGIESNFGTSGFVAECVETTTKLFDDLFGRRSLPDEAKFLSFRKFFNEDDSVLGMHYSGYGSENGVFFNSDVKCFKTHNKLKFNEITEKILWWHPTGHYLQTFVHEYAHSAHFKHLYEKGNEYIMNDLRNTRIPTAVGRFITKFKLGRYSATNMNEFMAERITKDVCKNLGSSDIYTGSKKDLDYESIFSRKWSYRYSTPQSYLDYFTQQVWNGEKEKANDVAEEMGIYLKKIESKEVSPVLEAVREKVPKPSLWSKLADSLAEINANITKNLDKRNNLILRKGY